MPAASALAWGSIPLVRSKGPATPQITAEAKAQPAQPIELEDLHRANNFVARSPFELPQ